MKSFRRFHTAIALAALASGWVASTSAIAQVTFPVVHPIVKVGDRWKMLSLDGYTKLQEGWLEQIVTAVGEDIEVAVRSDAGAQEPARYDRDWNALAKLREKVERQVKLDFPLEANKTWDSKYEWINVRGQDGRMEMTYKVRGTERITVPAGAFDTVVIDGRGYWYNTTAGGTGAAIEALWYAPSAKRVIRRTWVTRYANGQRDQNRLFEASEVDVKP